MSSTSRIYFPLLLLVLWLSPTPSSYAEQAPASVDEIVDAYVEARGGYGRIRAIRSLVFSQGVYSEGDYTGSGEAFMAFQRPFLRVVGSHPERAAGFMEGYDGAAWEWYENPGIVLRTVGPAARAIRRVADPEGSLIDYREKGIDLALAEPTMIDGRVVDRLIVTTPDGFRSDAFFDRETHLLVAASHSAPIHAYGPDVETITRFADFRPVAGVLFPFSDISWEVATGRELSRMQWGKIEANRELPTTWFSPPVFSLSRLQRLLRNLYGERADPDAVRFSYREFRRAYPEIDTREGCEVIGYQMLKMGAVDSAAALLRLNVEDHPDSASSAFGLARAWQRAGEMEKACAEARRALELDPEERRAAEILEGCVEAP